MVNVHRDCFSDSPQGHWCCVTVWGRGIRAHRESGALSSLFAFPLELTPSFRASTCAARIMEFNELNRELRGLIQHHLQECLDGGRCYYY